MYHKELVDQQARVTKLEQDIANRNADLDENAEYILKQEVCVGACSSSFLSFRPLYYCWNVFFLAYFAAGRNKP